MTRVMPVSERMVTARDHKRSCPVSSASGTATVIPFFRSLLILILFERPHRCACLVVLFVHCRAGEKAPAGSSRLAFWDMKSGGKHNHGRKHLSKFGHLA